MTTPRPTMTRRRFCQLLGGGIVVLIAAKPSRAFAKRRPYPSDFNAYLRIDESGHVTVFSGKIEMGQGALTSQAQMAAEELGVSLSAITMLVGDTDLCPWDAGTWGSLTTRRFGPVLRAAAAEARRVLLRLASERLGVARDKLVVEDGLVLVRDDPSRKVSYGELAKGKAIARLVDEKAALRSVAEFKVMGQSPVRMDALEKVTGRAKYAGDIQLPGMLYARILRPPSHGATMKSIDVAKAKAMPGVTLVQEKDLVAVLHADPEAASGALDLIDAEWTTPAAEPDTETVFDHLLAHGGKGEAQETKGDVAAARKKSARVFESTFRTPYRAHAPMEPHTALARIEDGKLTVWASTQNPFGVRDELREALGLDERHVRVITPFVGGGFGGKSENGQVLEAARLAKLTGKPVMLAWSREEEFFLDMFDPAGVVKIASAMGEGGKITLWDCSFWGVGDRAAELFYDVPNASLRMHGSPWESGPKLHPIEVGPWRAPGASTNVFARESQIDIMAASAKVDPLELRLRNTSDVRVRRTLQAAADAFGWKPAAGPSGQGRGIAIGLDSGTYAAVAASVKVDRKTGAVKVDRVVCAQDMGIVVNPTGAKSQMEGCISMGLGYVLSEELRFKGGQISDQSYATYRIPRFSWMPKIETVLVKNDELDPQGGGEPAIVPLGAAVANAVFDATGARLYRLPMTPERVLAALRPSPKG